MNLNLNNKQLSLLITTMLMMLVVLLLINIHLAAGAEDEYLYEISLEEEDIEELLQEKEALEQELAAQQKIKTHMAFNQAAKNKFTDDEPFKTLDELMQEAQNNDSNEAEDLNDDSGNNPSAEGYALDKYKERLQQLKASRGDNKTQELLQNNTANSNTSVSYSLVNRSHIQLPSPIYTCLVSGKVVVNIVVDANGFVVEATFNEASSNTTNGCLIDNAIAYALKAKFNKGSKPQQLGTITYLFQGK